MSDPECHQSTHLLSKILSEQIYYKTTNFRLLILRIWGFSIGTRIMEIFFNYLF